VYNDEYIALGLIGALCKERNKQEQEAEIYKTHAQTGSEALESNNTQESKSK